MKLARCGVTKGIDIDTSHFTEDFPPAASIEGCYSENDVPDVNIGWQTVVSATTLRGDAHHYFAVTSSRVFTHLRVTLYPDGGIARLRVYGHPQIDWDKVEDGAEFDLAACENGAYLVGANEWQAGLAANLQGRPALALLTAGREQDAGIQRGLRRATFTR
jgi:allantoicase